MTLILSGTNGVSDVDGSASTPAIRGSDSNTGIFFPAADTIAFAEGGAEVARIDSSGNFGLGVTPSAWGTVTGFQVKNASLYGFGNEGGLYANAYYGSGAWRYIANAAATGYDSNAASGQHRWYTAASGTAGNAISFTQAMTLDSSGNLLVGTTSYGGDGISFGPRASGSGTTSQIAFNRASTTTLGAAVAFQNGGSTVGNITYTNAAVAYNTTSDYRLKEDVQPMAGALDRVAALKPCTYKWKDDGSTGEGFIAHELQAVVPGCVTGEKDAVDAEGNPVYQGIDTSFLVATLTAAIQELKAELDTAKARIAALEAA